MSGLDLDGVARELRGTRLRGPLIHRAQTASTNDDVRALAAAGAAEGTVVIAGEQTQGRGRHARPWFGHPDHSLLFSVLLRPALPAEHWPRLVNMAGVAVADACAITGGCAVGTKWPNDLVIAGRKVGGILIEAQPPGFAIVGIGLNVLGDAADLPAELRATATSLAAHASGPVTRKALLAHVLNVLDEAYAALLDGHWGSLLARQREIETTLGQERTILTGTETLTGRVRDLSPEGGLVIETAAGLRTVTVGEVSWERSPTATRAPSRGR